MFSVAFGDAVFTDGWRV